ncbi:MAG: hypothetical protein ACYSWS_05785, partial [Planctomycetota bacterium]
VLVFIFSSATPSSAARVTNASSLGGGTTIVDFSQFDLFIFGTGPVEVGSQVNETILWSSTNPGALIGNGFYGLVGNMLWTLARQGFVGLNTHDVGESMRFDFVDGAVCGVGGFVNYATPFEHYGNLEIEALGNNDQILESWNITQDNPITSTKDDDGAFRGFLRDSNDIHALRLSGAIAALDDLEFTRVATDPFTEPVTIDIKPGSDSNCFNVNGHGAIPVAIFGSLEFDVNNIDIETLSLSGLDVRSRGSRGPLCSFEYVNNDEFLDMVCHFEDNADDWSPGDGVADLTGYLQDGTEFKGTDSICVVNDETGGGTDHVKPKKKAVDNS